MLNLFLQHIVNINVNAKGVDEFKTTQIENSDRDYKNDNVKQYNDMGEIEANSNQKGDTQLNLQNGIIEQGKNFDIEQNDKIYSTQAYVRPTITAHSETNYVGDGFDVIIESKDNFANVSKLEVPIWSSKDGQDDLVWYQCNLANVQNNKYALHVNINKHKYDLCEYNIHTYITDIKNEKFFVESYRLDLTPQIEVHSTLSEYNNQIVLNAKGDVFKSYDVWVAVWSEENGQDDLRWYKMNKNGRDSSYNVNLNHHRDSGKYFFHYYLKTSTTSRYINANTLQINNAASKHIEIISQNGNGTYITHSNTNISDIAQVVVYGKCVPSNISTIKVASWSVESGQDDIKWKTMNKDSNGNYISSINTQIDLLHYRKINVHVYAFFNDGSSKFIADTYYNIDGPSAEISATPNYINGTFDIEISDIKEYDIITKIELPTWSVNKGQDNIKFYVVPKNKDINGIIKFSINISNHFNEYFEYMFHMYFTDIYGKRFFVSNCTQQYQPIFETNTYVENNNAINMSIMQKIPIQYKIIAYVWSLKNGKDDIKQYELQKIGDINQKTINVSNHKNIGDYQIDYYLVALDNSKNYFVKSDLVNISDGDDSELTFEIVSEKGNGEWITNKQTKYSDDVKIIVGKNSVSKDIVRMESTVWSEKNGQDDIFTQQMLENDETYYNYINNSTLKHLGIINVEIYGYNNKDEKTKLYEGYYTLKQPEVSVGSYTINRTNGTYTINFNRASALGLSSMKTLTYPVKDLGLMKTQILSNSANSATINIRDFSSYLGKYSSTLYYYDVKGDSYYGGQVDIDMLDGKKGMVVKSADEMSVLCSYDGELPSGYKMKFYIWSSNNGQDDLKIHYLTKQGSVYKYTINTSDQKVKDIGLYHVHFYIETDKGEERYVNGSTFEISSPTIETLKLSKCDGTTGQMTIEATGIKCPSGVEKVQVAVWSETGGQDDLKWYDMKNINGVYTYTIDIKNHERNFGLYNFHIYTSMNNKRFAFTKSATQNIKAKNYVWVDGSDSDSKRTVHIRGANHNNSYISECWIAIWSETGGQDDLTWCKLPHLGNSNFDCGISYSTFKHTGTLNAHFYKQYCVGFIRSTKFKISPPPKNEKVEKYISEAIRIVKDDNIGYVERGSSDDVGYDCSGLVYHCLNYAGISVPRFGTSTMKEHMPAFNYHEGFNKSIIKRGDILWRNGHTAIYIGSSQLVDAAGNENGRYAQKGDQMGNEIAVRPFYKTGTGDDYSGFFRLKD